MVAVLNHLAQIIDKLRPYAKTVVAVAGGVVLVAQEVASVDSTPASVGTVLLVALGVYQAKNREVPS